jgi:type I restriction enzyme, S subunit
MTTTMPLSEFITLQRGFDLPSSQRKEGEIPVVASTGIAGYHNEHKVEGPGVVIGRSGSIGGGQYIEGDFWPLNTTLWVKDFKGSNPRFAYYLLRSIDFGRFNAGAGVPTLNRNHIASLRIRTHGRHEQDRIAAIVSAYDDLIENNRRRIQLLEQAARLLYKEWFVHLRFPGHEHVKVIDGVPEGWEKSAIGEKFRTVLGGTPSRKNLELWGGNVAWINSGEVNKLRILAETEFITEEGLSKSAAKLMPTGTTVLAITGATLGQVSRLEIDCAANQSVVGIYDPDDLQNEWIYLFFVHEIRRIINHATGGAQQHINKEIVNATEFMNPSKPLLAHFREAVHPNFEVVRNLEMQNLALSSARDLLLPRLMSGEVAV